MKPPLTTDEVKVFARYAFDILELVAVNHSEEWDEILASVVSAVTEAGAYASAGVEARNFVEALDERSVGIAPPLSRQAVAIVPAQKRLPIDAASALENGASGTTAFADGITIRNGV
jgi:hypothetical protein